MSFLTRSSATIRSTVLRSAPRARLLAPVRFASQDYGSGEGNPVGEKPQQQGKNPREDLEHPGPPPPNVGKGKQTSSSQSESKSPKSSERSVDSSPKSSGGTSGGDGASKDGAVKGAQPKILNENPPDGENQSEDVRRHNEEMDRRAERAHEQVSNADAKKDKAPPKK